MNYSNIRFIDSANGTGVRVSLFVSGCENHCEGCFSPMTWDYNFGNAFTQIEENEIIEACKKSYISGLTILGGDPMELSNQLSLHAFIKKFKEACPDKTIWLYTGYVYEKDLQPGQRRYIQGTTSFILDNVDVLVDGPFILEQRDITLKFRGSKNQRLLTKEDRAKLNANINK